VLRSRDDATARARPTLAGLLVVVALSLVLLAESLVPGRALVPLVADDFEAWGAGKDPADLRGHPHPNWCMSDVLHLLAPGFAVTAGAVQRGELPLWDATQALGLPHLHQVHHGLLYPPAWIVVLLGWRGSRGPPGCTRCSPAWACSSTCSRGAHAHRGADRRDRLHALGLGHGAPAIGAGGGGRGLAAVGAGRPRARRADRAAAALSGRRRGPGALVSRRLPAGHALDRDARRARRARARRRAPAQGPPLGGAAAARGRGPRRGAALALPQLLPTLDYLVHDSQRSTQTSEQVAQTGLETPLLWQLLVPDRYATTTLTGAHPLALLDLQQARTPAAINRAETSMGIGVLGLVLALLAILFGRGWRTRLYAGVALASLALLCTPVLLRAGATVFPLLRLGSPKRLLLLTSFALAVLAAGGVDLLRGPRLRVSVAAWAASLAVAIAALVSLIGVPGGHDGGQIDAWAARIAAASGQADVRAAQVKAAVPPENFALAADAAHRGKRAGGRRGARSAGAAPPAAPADGRGLEHARPPPRLAAARRAVDRAAPRRLADAARRADRAPRTRARQHRPPQGPAARSAAARRGRRPRSAGRALAPRARRRRPELAASELPRDVRLHDLQCYAPMAPRRLCALLDALEPGVVLSGSAIGGFQQEATLASPLLDLLGVDALLTSHEAELPPGWKEGGRAGPVRVLVNDEALPRAFVVPRAEAVTGEAERLARLTAPDFDPRAVVLLEDRAAASRAPSAAPDAPPRVATITAWSPGHLTIEVPEGEPGVLVVSEGWHDGWRASIGGQRVPVWCADQTVLAVPLENRDDQIVELVFDPPLVRVAAWVGAALWAALLVGVLWPSRRIEPAAA
jgi:hypothetical protein